MCTAPQKCNIYKQFCNERDPWYVSCFDCDVYSCFDSWSTLSQSSWIRRYTSVAYYYYYYYVQHALTLKISSLLTLEISRQPSDMRRPDTCVTADGIQRSTQVLGIIQQGQSNPNDDCGHSSPSGVRRKKKTNISTTNLGIDFFCLLIGLLLNEGHHVLNLKQEKHKSLLFFSEPKTTTE